MLNTLLGQQNAAALAANHHATTVDLRGHGNSGKTDKNHILEQHARDVRHLIHQLDLDDVTLMSCSMGTAVALTYLALFGKPQFGRHRRVYRCRCYQ